MIPTTSSRKIKHHHESYPHLLSFCFHMMHCLQILKSSLFTLPKLILPLSFLLFSLGAFQFLYFLRPSFSSLSFPFNVFSHYSLLDFLFSPSLYSSPSCFSPPLIIILPTFIFQFTPVLFPSLSFLSPLLPSTSHILLTSPSTSHRLHHVIITEKSLRRTKNSITNIRPKVCP